MGEDWVPLWLSALRLGSGPTCLLEFLHVLLGLPAWRWFELYCCQSIHCRTNPEASETPITATKQTNTTNHQTVIAWEKEGDLTWAKWLWCANDCNNTVTDDWTGTSPISSMVVATWQPRRGWPTRHNRRISLEVREKWEQHWCTWKTSEKDKWRRKREFCWGDWLIVNASVSWRVTMSCQQLGEYLMSKVHSEHLEACVHDLHEEFSAIGFVRTNRRIEGEERRRRWKRRCWGEGMGILLLRGEALFQ